MPRSRGYYRYKREEKIARKKRILDYYRLDNAPHYLDELDTEGPIKNSYGYYEPYTSVKHDGYLSKGKIHCSCMVCAFHEVPLPDKRKMDSMNEAIKDIDVPESEYPEFDDLYYYYDMYGYDYDAYDDEDYHMDGAILHKLENRLKKKRNKYEVRGGFKGTSMGSDHNCDYDEFHALIKKKELHDSLGVYPVDGHSVLAYENTKVKFLKKGDKCIYWDDDMERWNFFTFNHSIKNRAYSDEGNCYTKDVFKVHSMFWFSLDAHRALKSILE